MSQFVWLDYSESDRQKMEALIEAFREKDTRDELGIGAVRDAFSDMLFPGTSTVMTRARYFLLVPWTYQRLEELAADLAKSVAERARLAELMLIKAIDESDDSDGNIGRIAKSALKRLPSSVYWQGLGVWGIRAFPQSQAQYHSSLVRYSKESARRSKRAEERDSEHDDLLTPNWHGGLVGAPKGFPGECGLGLRREDAEYLVDRLCLSEGTSKSLLAEIVRRRRRPTEVEFVWKWSDLAEFPAVYTEMVTHAQCFSEVIHGAALLYNLMLAEAPGWEETLTGFRKRWDEWAELMRMRAGYLQTWNRERFWQLVGGRNARVTEGTKTFINGWWDLVLAGHEGKLRENAEARQMIRERELRLKKKLARIGNLQEGRAWNGDSGSAQLDFRWNIARRLLADIFNGLGVRANA